MNLVSLQGWLDNAAFAVLFVTMLVYWAGAAFPTVPYLQTAGTTGMAIANLCIAGLLGARWIEGGYFPLSNLYESLFFVAWGITAMHLLAENMSRSRLVGAVTAPVAMGIAAFAALSLPDAMQHSEPLVPALKSNWLMMHVSVMLLSYAALMVGALMAIAFLIVTRGQEVELRGSSVGTGGFRDARYRIKRAGQAVDTLEPLTASTGNTAVLETAPAVAAAPLSPQRLSLADTLDNISYRIIGLGFPLLTIGIIAGAVWANEAWGSYWSWDPKETWALITWLVFAAYLHARITRGWQGRRPAILAASGFLVVWVCYLGVNLLGKGLHSYGWFL
ncbi:c-type cytochrome biogenesis protein CcsB [Thermoleptolyngbya sichuanensis A183]|uniref:Cytochrome c biogenesis protein CcsA n=2 Tax=Thermoleptolyngbya TaxID=2303528 RepID=A0A6M8BAK9_9CYAN|nr:MULTISPECIES: c-type cytochrome biogenesis protein CcsB [Thermoleptolyngbya]QKD83638.1 c-type cytochrome biogenesis protein CcsB [Thermoleptolyngbya sichuanensis A183]WOB41772.1 c-type cytochrome biogenesis protein CcsB [Thermoleptolyngbya oregonensis NK1-22]HIK39189.1 c-type cytochrome biogenesis protein CcsB [Thermoleptolyngbya sp. M55_K2018_002]